MTGICLFSLAFFLYLRHKHLKMIKELKPGDKIRYNGFNGEILEVLPEGKFILKLETNGLTLVKDE
jgi:preprotein translocase subunit YajC